MWGRWVFKICTQRIIFTNDLNSQSCWGWRSNKRIGWDSSAHFWIRGRSPETRMNLCLLAPFFHSIPVRIHPHHNTFQKKKTFKFFSSPIPNVCFISIHIIIQSHFVILHLNSWRNRLWSQFRPYLHPGASCHHSSTIAHISSNGLRVGVVCDLLKKRRTKFHRSFRVKNGEKKKIYRSSPEKKRDIAGRIITRERDPGCHSGFYSPQILSPRIKSASGFYPPGWNLLADFIPPWWILSPQVRADSEAFLGQNSTTSYANCLSSRLESHAA